LIVSERTFRGINRPGFNPNSHRTVTHGRVYEYYEWLHYITFSQQLWSLGGLLVLSQICKLKRGVYSVYSDLQLEVCSGL